MLNSTQKRIAIGWCVLILHAVLTATMAVFLGVWALFLAFPLAFLVMALPYWLNWLGQGEDIFTLFWVLLFTSPIFVFAQGENTLPWLLGGSPPPVSVSKAEGQGERWIYHFLDSRVLYEDKCMKTESAMVQPYPRSPSRVRYEGVWAVAPIVGEDWKEGDPVLFWAGCRFQSCREHWKRPGGGGYIWLSDRAEFKEALKACGAGRMSGGREPRLLYWAEKPRRALRVTVLMAWIPLFLGGSVWSLWIWRRDS